MLRVVSWLLAPFRWLRSRSASGDATDAAADQGTVAGTSSVEPAYLKRLETGADGTRQAAKWLITAFAAIAAILVAGTQFSSIGSLSWGWRLGAAIGSAALILVGLAIAVWLLLDVMLISETTIDDLARQYGSSRKSALIKWIERNPAELRGFENVGTLSSRFREALVSQRVEMLAYYDARVNGEDQSVVDKAAIKAQAATERLAYIQGDATYVVRLMAYEQLRSRMAGGRRVAMFIGAFAVAIGVGVFAWAVNPPHQKAATPANLAGARLADARLTTARLANANLRNAHLERATLVGADLSGADVTNAVLRGADLRRASLTDVHWKNTICPDGTNSDTHLDGCASRRSPK